MSEIVREEQLNLFSVLFEQQELEEKQKRAQTSAKKEEKVLPSKPVVPEIFEKFQICKELEEVMRLLSHGDDEVYILYSGYRYSSDYKYDLQVVSNRLYRCPMQEEGSMIRTDTLYPNKEHTMNVMYISEDGNVWNLPIKTEFRSQSYSSGSPYTSECIRLEVKKPSILKKLMYVKEYDGFDSNVIINKDQAGRILQKINPYAYDYIKTKYMYPKEESCVMLLMAPQLEQLSKADYGFANRILSNIAVQEEDVDRFNRLTQPGKNLKEIFKCSKKLYTALKDESYLGKWDIYRKMEKQGKFTKDTILQAIDSNYDEWHLNQVNRILNRRYNGKPVFTWDTLQNYLRRLDTFQALSGRDAFQILYDYLIQCEELEIEPRIDSDSLKREHDVTARTLREKRDEIMAKKMEGACDYLKVNNYEEDIYFIRGIRDYDDLIDEAKQQRNCVASYARSIISRRSLIYVMRRKSDPDKSLITVEIDPGQSVIRQKYLACNRPIYNKSQTEFLDRWISKVRLRVKLGDDHISDGKEQVETCSFS